MTRHSHQDALTEEEFDRLFEATSELDDYFELEARFILVAGGRLGMRAGEICHMDESWINWEESIIHIPWHEPCDCGYCRTQSQDAVERESSDKSFDEELQDRWKPKTENSARAIPFDFTERTKEAVEEFFFWQSEFPHSRSSINRRVDRVLEAAGMPNSKCYPHALRATAGTWHAYRGVPAAALQSLMGWSQMSVAEKYIRLSGGATARALKEAHSDE